jgi:hypothetical protein
MKLKKAVNGEPELEEALTLYLKPPPMSDEAKRYKRSDTAYKRQQKQREKKKAKEQQKRREWLQANTNVLRDTSIAAKGKVWNGVIYLWEKIKDEQNGSSKWTKYNWEYLIPEFGESVAEAFRDGCIGYWRKYSPDISSENIGNYNTNENAVIIGLSGLEMEARSLPNWPENLSKNEAKLACRYAFNEMNGFPDWLSKLHNLFPNIVENAILKEIEYEFCQYDGEHPCHYVLTYVFYSLNWLNPKISNQIIAFLKNHEPKHDDTIKKALGIALSVNNIDKKSFVELAKSKVKNIKSISRQGLWLAAWMDVDSKSAFKTLKSIFNEISNAKEATKFAMIFIGSLLGRHGERIKSEYKDYVQPQMLLSLIKLMHSYIRISEDINRANTGVYTPNLRDYAQEARSHLFNLLTDIHCKQTYLALMDLYKNHPNKRSREWCLIYAKQHAAKAAEFESWNPENIAIFAEEAELAPKNNQELFDMAVSRLLDLKADLEDGDNSIAEILQSVKEETKHRNVIANWLREHSLEKYSISQEEELADAKKPDIRLRGFGFDAPVPIELKIVDNKWTVKKLIERLKNQLCGQYMRDIRSNYGIFLLVYLGNKKFWKHPKTGNHINFDELISLLEKEAEKITNKNKKIESIKIIGINLLKRNTHNDNFF